MNTDLAASQMLSKEGPISAAMSGRRSMVPKRLTPLRNKLASRLLQLPGHSSDLPCSSCTATEKGYAPWVLGGASAPRSRPQRVTSNGGVG